MKSSRRPAKRVAPRARSARLTPTAVARPARQKKSVPAASGGLYGIGIDMVEIARMERLLARQGRRALDKMMMPAERREALQRGNLARALAMAWAAKEACAKALGTGFRDELGFRDIGVQRAANGRPSLVFSAAQRKRLRALGVGVAHLSLTDEAGMACAYVVLERAAL